MGDDQVLNAINDFKGNMMPWYMYPSIEKYNFTEQDKAIIKGKILLFQNYNVGDLRTRVIMREFIGELAKDRVNEIGIGLPILSWD